MSLMSRTRSYTFKDSKGEIHVLSLQEAAKLVPHDEAIRKRFDEIVDNTKNIRRKKDGFEPGIQPNTGLYAGGPLEYQKQLKDLGLVEIGYDYVPQESKGDYNYCRTDEFVQSCLEAGIELSGTEIEAIKSGDYYKDSEPLKVSE
jgi:hypothetical protein